MKHKKIFFIVGIIMIISLIMVSILIEKPSKKRVVPFTDKIDVQIKNDTFTNSSATIIITDLTGKNNIYDESFQILKYNNGKWEEPKHNPKIVAGFSYYPDENGILELYCDWKPWYGALSNGRYRLVKSVYMQTGNEHLDKYNHEEYYFFVEFEIKD